jgi:Ca2+-binding EF-hand superfamily protein
MGNALTSLKINFKDKEHYVAWTFDDVVNAYEKYVLPPFTGTQEDEYNELEQELSRLKVDEKDAQGSEGAEEATAAVRAAKQKLDQWVNNLQKQDGALRPALMIRKKEFMRYFCDYATPSTSGAVVVLPLSEFEVYAQDGGSTILALEPFIMLVLLSNNATKKTKLEFLFKMFDLNLNGSLNRDEIKTLMIVLRNTLHKTASAPYVEDVEGLTDIVLDLIDKNKDKNLSRDEFVKWASSEDQGVNLIGKFMGGEPQRLLEMDRKNVLRRKTKLDVGKSGMKKSALDKYNMGSAHSRREKRITDYYGQREKEGYGKGALKAYDRKLTFNEEFGRLDAVASREVLTNLIFETDFAFKDLSDLRLQFADAAGTTERNGRNCMNIDTLKKVLMAHFPRLEDGQTLARIAAVFDIDGSGMIDFTEFVTGLNLAVAGEAKPKIELILRVYDRNGDGTVSEGEIIDALKDVQDDNDQIIEFTLDNFEVLDTNGDGKIDLAELADFLLANSIVLNFMWQFFPAPSTKSAQLMAQLASRQPTKEGEPQTALLENVVLLATTMRTSDVESADLFLSRLREVQIDIPRPCPLDHPAVQLYSAIYGEVKDLTKRPEIKRGQSFRGISGAAVVDQAYSEALVAAEGNAEEATRPKDSAPSPGGAPVPARKLSKAVFRDLRGYTPQQRLLNAMFKGAAKTRKDKAMAICLAVDAEGKTVSNRIIEKAELVAYLQHGQADYDEMHAYAQNAISILDTSKDGAVDITEMTEAMTQDPLLLEFFGGLYNLDFSVGSKLTPDPARQKSQFTPKDGTASLDSKSRQQQPRPSTRERTQGRSGGRKTQRRK